MAGVVNGVRKAEAWRPVGTPQLNHRAGLWPPPGEGAISKEPEALLSWPLPRGAPEGDPNLSALLGQELLCRRDGETGGPGLGPEPPQTRQRNRSQPSWLPAQSRLPGGLANSWAGLLPGLAGSA